MGITLTQSTGHSIDRFASRQVSKSAKGVRDAALRVRRSEKLGERGKGLAGGEAFFSLFPPKFRISNRRVQARQICWGVLAWKWFVFMGHYFGAEAKLLTISENKAKGR